MQLWLKNDLLNQKCNQLKTENDELKAKNEALTQAKTIADQAYQSIKSKYDSLNNFTQLEIDYYTINIIKTFLKQVNQPYISASQLQELIDDLKSHKHFKIF